MRTSPDVLDLDAAAAFREACEELRVPVRPLDRPDLYAIDVDGRPLLLSIHGATLVTPDRVTTLTRRSTPDGAVPLLVADKILSGARPGLEAAGWGWLDRRGRLHLRAGGALIDTDVDPAPRATRRRRPSAALAARGAQEVAVAVLLAPDEPLGVRELARRSGLAPSTTSRVLAELRDLGLVRADNRPVTPDLFWTLADQWDPDWIALAERLDPADEQLLQPATTTAPAGGGPAITDTRAALAWHAPVVASRDAAVSLYVADRADADRVVASAGRAARSGGFATDRVAVAPVRSTLSNRFARPGEPWPVVHPLIVALDLAADRARGHQILDEWTPEDAPRVW